MKKSTSYYKMAARRIQSCLFWLKNAKKPLFQHFDQFFDQFGMLGVQLTIFEGGEFDGGVFESIRSRFTRFPAGKTGFRPSEMVKMAFFNNAA